MIRNLLRFLFPVLFIVPAPMDFRFNRHQIFELLFSILTLSILAAIALTTYSNYIRSAKLLSGICEKYNSNSMYVFHALNGVWPETNEQLQKFDSYMGFNFENTMSESKYIESLDIIDGAFNFRFNEKLEGKTLTLRPATPVNYPDGPVILVCGKNKPGWDLYGEDKTTVNDDFLLRVLQ